MDKRRRGRGWKAARNLAIFALFLAGMWAGYQSPWWMMEFALHQRTQEEVEILWKGGKRGLIAGGERIDSTFSGGPHSLVALVGGELRFAALASYEGHPHIRMNGGSPLGLEKPVVRNMFLEADFIADYDGGEWFLAAGLPENAVSGMLTVTMGNGTAYTVSATREMDVLWFPVTLAPEEYERYDWTQWKQAVCELMLYDGRGELISQTVGPVCREVTVG